MPDRQRGLVLAIRRADLSDEECELMIDLLVELRAQPGGRHRAGLPVEQHARRVRWCIWNWSFYLALFGLLMFVGASGFG